MTHPTDDPPPASAPCDSDIEKSRGTTESRLTQPPVAFVEESMRVESWRQRQAQLTDSVEMSQVFDVFADGLRLLGELDVGAQQTGCFLLELESFVFDRFDLGSASNAEALALGAHGLLDEVERRFFQFVGDSSCGQAMANARIQSLHLQLDAMAPVLTLLQGGGWDPYRCLMVKLAGLEREIRHHARNRSADASRFRSIEQELHELRTDAVYTQARAFLEGLEEDGPDEKCLRDAEQLWLLLDTAERLVIQLHEDVGAEQVGGETLETLVAKTDWLKSRISDALGRLDSESRNSWIDSHIDAMRELGRAALSDAEDLQPAAAVVSMRRVRERIEWFLKLWPDERSHRPLRPLRKLSRNLLNEWVEKTTNYRLARTFGFGFVRWLENAVLVSILAISVLLIYEFATDSGYPAPVDIIDRDMREAHPNWEEDRISRAIRQELDRLDVEAWMPDDDFRYYLQKRRGIEDVAEINQLVDNARLRDLQIALVDLFFCSIFLFEFFVKLFHAPLKVNFFRRNWLFSLLPAIPFGIIVYALQTMPVLQNLTALRAARLPQLVRYLRVVRPLIRFMRLVLFALRAMDKIVQRYGSLLNRDLVFLEPATRPGASRIVEQRAERLRRSLNVRQQELAKDMNAGAFADFLRRQIRLNRELLPYSAAIVSWPANESAGCVVTSSRASQGVRAEDAVDSLIHAEAETIEQTMGVDFSMQMDKLSRVATLPPLRWMPVFNRICKARKSSKDKGERVARIATIFGEYLQTINRCATWVADLNGVITAPQLVYRIGGTIVKGTERPAKRLIMLGGAFVLLTFLVDMFGVGLLNSVTASMRQMIFGPLLIVGLIAFILMLTGKWLQTIASSASDFFARAAEASYLGLLVDVKQTHAKRDLTLLEERILRPEALALGMAEQIDRYPSPGIEDSGRSVDARVLFRSSLRQCFELRDVPAGSLPERIYLLYRDYLASPPLHRNGTHTANQLLGNLSMLEIMERTLNLSKKERKELDKLDLERSNGIAGPSLWFNFVTLALAQRTAELVVDYNRYVIPLEELSSRPTSERERYAAWLKDKVLENELRETVVVESQADANGIPGSNIGPAESLPDIDDLIARLTCSTSESVHAEGVNTLREVQARVRELRDRGMSRESAEKDVGLNDKHLRELGMATGSDVDWRRTAETTRACYSTTSFTALEFLTNDTRRYRSLTQRFGPELADLLRIDRLRLIRDIFATIPGYAKPQFERSFNPYELYWNFLGGGRIFLLPFRIGWLFLRYTFKGLLWFVLVVRELLDPNLKKPVSGPSVASYDVAVRKINRMRKPIFLAATKLRARMDVEYCGLLLPGETETGLEGQTLEDDLDRIQASRDETGPFLDIERNHRVALRELNEFLRRKNILGTDLGARLDEIETGYSIRRREVLRAIAIAFVVDFDKLRQFAVAKPHLDELVAQAVAAKGVTPGRSWWTRRLDAFRHEIVLLVLGVIGRDNGRKTFQAWWSRYRETSTRLTEDIDLDDATRAVYRWWRSDIGEFRGIVRLVESVDGYAEDAAIEIIERVMRHPRTWSEQLVTIRMIQSLSLLDIYSDRRIVRTLGGFSEDEGEPEQVTVVTTLG